MTRNEIPPIGSCLECGEPDTTLNHGIYMAGHHCQEAVS